LAGEERSGFDTSANSAEILYGKSHGYTRRPESMERISPLESSCTPLPARM
jgi:hypothetical protein